MDSDDSMSIFRLLMNSVNQHELKAEITTIQRKTSSISRDQSLPIVKCHAQLEFYASSIFISTTRMHRSAPT